MRNDPIVTILLMTGLLTSAFVVGVATVQHVPVSTLTIEAVEYFLSE